ncbi:MAG: hypothetical protein JWM56_970 [Candidatus Peribacteria bacterium]|nr:hypothetical protein [Candidatus Peribacteria bacterium]
MKGIFEQEGLKAVNDRIYIESFWTYWRQNMLHSLSMTDITSLAEAHKDLPEDDQKKAGQAIAGTMNAEHEQFMIELVKLVDTKQINLIDLDSFLNHEAFDLLKEGDRDKIGLSLRNIADQVTRIYEFYTSTETPNSSPQLETMVEYVWQMKSRVEARYGNVFKF